MFLEISAALEVINGLCSAIEQSNTRYKQDIYDKCASYQFMLNLLCENVARYEDKLTIKQQSIIEDRIITTQSNINYTLETIAEEV